MARKVLIVHFRVGKTDGVSIEIANWKEILERLRWEVSLMAGPISDGADWIVEKFECQLNPEIFSLDNEAFGGYKEKSEEQFVVNLRTIQDELSKEFAHVLDEVKPDRVIVSNVFSVGLNVAAAGALAEELKKRHIKTISVNHDFWWENIRYRRPSGQAVERQLDKYFPPVGDWIKHVCINSIARRDLAARKGVMADLLYDSMDFEIPSRDKNGKCKSMLEAYGVTEDDLVVLQGTRIVRRKNIELSMDLVKELEKHLERLSKNRIVLVMAGYAEKRDEEYLVKLRGYAKKLNINVVELNGMNNAYNQDSNEKCDLFSVYPYADLVTYPSEYEGFGNQFLEAIHAKKPIVIYEYPVFKTDIKPLGFEVISLGDDLSFDADTGLAKIDPEVLGRVGGEVVEILISGERRKEMVEKNFELGKIHFSFEKTAETWKALLG